MVHLRIRKHHTIASMLCLSLLAVSPAWAQLGTTNIIALTGVVPPEGNGDFNFLFSSIPVLNGTGQVAFFATLKNTSGGTADDSGLYLHNGSVLVNLARENPAGLLDSGLTDLDFPALNEAGQVVFRATRIPSALSGGTPLNGIFRGSGGALTFVALEGNAAPDGNGVFSFLGFPALNASGQAAFFANFTGTSGGTSDNTGIFRGSGGAVTQIAREGNAVPGGNGVFSLFPTNPALNASGQAVFTAELTGTSGGSSDDRGIFLGSGGAVTQIAREGAAVPDGNGAFSSFGFPALNNAGQAAFTANLTGTSGGSSDDRGIFLGSGGAVTQIARAGNATPDGNGAFSSFGSPALNASGQLAFTANLTGTSGGSSDDRGIFLGSGGAVTQIARGGDAVPDGNGAFSLFGEPALNTSGQVAFFAFLTGTSGVNTDDRGLFLANGMDVIQVAREGQGLGGSTITSLVFTSGAGANGDQRSGLNDTGQVVYAASLANGDHVIARFTLPDVHWTNPGSGFWTTDANWSLGIEPNSFYDTFIDPDSGTTVGGNFSNSFVKSLTIGATTSGEAVLELDNGGDLESLEPITINSRGRIFVGAGRVLTAPSLVNHGELGGDGQIDAVLTNQPSGEVRADAGQALRFTAAGSHLNAGRIEAVGGQIEFDAVLTNVASTGLITGRDATLRFTGGLTNHGAVAISFGTSDVHGPITNTATGSVVVSGNANVTFYDDISNAGVINVANGSTAVFFGALSGNGVGGAGTVFLEGDTRPGFSPGVMSFGGDVHLGFFSSLRTELGGLTPGAGHDQLAVAGDVTLGGTLDVAGFGGFTLTPGMVFEIITFGGSLTGSFNNVINSTGLNGLILSVTSDADSVNLVLDALAGDLNLDGFVGIADLNLVLGSWNQNVTTGIWQLGDPTGDGFVGIADLNAVLGNWNAGSPPQAKALLPEPGTMGVLMLGGALLLRRRRRVA